VGSRIAIRACSESAGPLAGIWYAKAEPAPRGRQYVCKGSYDLDATDLPILVDPIRVGTIRRIRQSVGRKPGCLFDLRKMARDLENWANEAEKIQRVRRRPLLESSIALH